MSDYPELERIAAEHDADALAYALELCELMRQLDRQIPPSWPNAEACGCCATEHSYRLREHRPGTNKPSKVRRHCPRCDVAGVETIAELDDGMEDAA